MLRAFRPYTCLAVAEPAPDVPGAWVAHCLTFDVLAQGSSLQEALRLVMESTSMIVAEDLEDGLDPEARRAPDKAWELFSEAMIDGRRISMEDAESRPFSSDGMSVCVCHFTIARCSKRTEDPLLKYAPMMVSKSLGSATGADQRP